MFMVVSELTAYSMFVNIQKFFSNLRVSVSLPFQGDWLIKTRKGKENLMISLFNFVSV